MVTLKLLALWKIPMGKIKNGVKPGDLVVHIGATKNGYRVKLVADLGIKLDNYFGQITQRETIFFSDGRWDWKDSWRLFDGW